MSKSIALHDVEVWLLLEHRQHKRGFSLSHEIHFNDRLGIFENVLFFLHADRLKYLSYPCYESLIVLILEEDDF
jgi:hypothetical protein